MSSLIVFYSEGQYYRQKRKRHRIGRLIIAVIAIELKLQHQTIVNYSNKSRYVKKLFDRVPLTHNSKKFNGTNLLLDSRLKHVKFSFFFKTIKNFM